MFLEEGEIRRLKGKTGSKCKIESKQELTIYYFKIEGSALFKEQLLFSRVKLLNNIVFKFLMKKYTPVNRYL